MNLKLIEKLREYPVVTRNTLMKLGYKKEYSYLVLQRLEKRGILKKIIKGKYTLIDDIYKIATNIYYPSYISFLTASMLKKCTEQIINTVQVSSNYNKVIDFQNSRIEFIKNKYLFGYNDFIADNEKLLIDMLLYRNHSGNFSEILKVVKNLEFNKDKLISYLNKISKTSLSKRIGYLLEKYKNIDMSQHITIDNNYVNLDVFKTSRKTNSKYRLKYD